MSILTKHRHIVTLCDCWTPECCVQFTVIFCIITAAVAVATDVEVGEKKGNDFIYYKRLYFRGLKENCDFVDM